MKVRAIQLMSLLFIICLSTGAVAQQTIQASDILNDIQEGKNISYENVTISGALDLTFMDEKVSELPKKSKWWKNGNNTVEEEIESRISFVNCTFSDDVLAYIHVESSGYTFIASFENDLKFENCTFSDKAMFKYSEFEGDTSFAGTKFQDDSTFKYAKFDNMANFENAVFSEDAIFKYSKFSEGVSFNNTRFEDNLNIKYTKVKGKFDTNNMFVGGDVDAKYTSINNESFTKQLLNKN